MHSKSNSTEILEIYTASDTDFPYPTLGNDVPEVCTLQTAKDFLRKNYVSCHQKHEDCRPMISYLPKRVVDITGPEYKLIEPPSGTVGSYAVVSYACGDGKFLTTDINTRDPRRSFDQNMMPGAVRDAAMLARSVQIQYLWIDSLCRVQNNPTDMRDHAAKIGEILEGAAFTIAASAAPDSSASLFVSRTSRYQEIDLFHEGSGIWKNIVFKARRKIPCGNHAKTGRMANLDCDALDTRASALQERLLARRLISFTGAEIQWKCRSVQACECRAKPYPSCAPFSVPAPSPGLNLLLLWSESWSQIIEEHSARKVETQQDRLQAICGLKEKYGAMAGFTYIDGLWNETLLYDLSWQRDGDVSLDGDGSLEISTSGNPTFSWASLAGAVNFQFARYSHRGPRTPHAELVDAKRITVGRLDTRSSIIMRGYTVDATLRASNDDLQAFELCVGGAYSSSNANQAVPCEVSIDILGEGERDVILLSLYSISYQNSLYEVFLILGKSRGDTTTCERVGIGSGKFYDGAGNNVNLLRDRNPPKAFDWLADNLTRGGSEFGGMSQRLITIW